MDGLCSTNIKHTVELRRECILADIRLWTSKVDARRKGYLCDSKSSRNIWLFRPRIYIGKIFLRISLHDSLPVNENDEMAKGSLDAT